MTVFVDDWRVAARVGRLSARWSHLVTDAPVLDELHAFAARIGLRRAWFQPGRPGRPWTGHYDVTDTKRRVAIAAGAWSITWEQTGRLMAALRVVDRGGDGPVFRLTHEDEPTDRGAVLVGYSVPAAAGLVCVLCDQPPTTRAVEVTGRVVQVGPVWAHRDCRARVRARYAATTTQLHADHYGVATTTGQETQP